MTQQGILLSKSVADKAAPKLSYTYSRLPLVFTPALPL